MPAVDKEPALHFEREAVIRPGPIESPAAWRRKAQLWHGFRQTGRTTEDRKGNRHYFCFPRVVPRADTARRAAPSFATARIARA